MKNDMGSNMADSQDTVSEEKPKDTKSITDMTTLAIKNYLHEREFLELDEKWKLERQAEDLFTKQSKVYIYEASDYCGLKAGPYEFYYGYEVTDNANEDEWCFVARENGIQVLTIPSSKLWPNEVGILWYLLSGIGQYLQFGVSDLAKQEGGLK